METTQYQGPPPSFDIPIDEKLLLDEALRFKSQGYDQNSMPLGHIFAGEQNKDFYLGMLAAFQIIDIAIMQQDVNEMSLREMNTFMSMHALMLAHKKGSRIIF